MYGSDKYSEYVYIRSILFIAQRDRDDKKMNFSFNIYKTYSTLIQLRIFLIHPYGFIENEYEYKNILSTLYKFTH